MNAQVPPDVTSTSDSELLPQLALASLGALLVGVAYLLLPAALTVGPNWLVLALDILLLLPVAFAIIVRPVHHNLLRAFRTGLQVVLTLALLSSIVLLIGNLPNFRQGGQLLRPAALLWLTNILIFAGWYWEIDGDGPFQRRQRNHTAVDFLFPQQVGGKTWAAGFVDYLFLAFCFATALSPADTAPLTARAKLLMMGEAVVSLLILILLIARSVNIY
jgi:uncharacterized membrane protein